MDQLLLPSSCLFKHERGIITHEKEKYYCSECVT